MRSGYESTVAKKDTGVAMSIFAGMFPYGVHFAQPSSVVIAHTIPDADKPQAACEQQKETSYCMYIH